MPVSLWSGLLLTRIGARDHASASPGLILSYPSTPPDVPHSGQGDCRYTNPLLAALTPGLF